MAELQVWDETKENVMPLKGGRRKKGLGLAPKPSAVEDERRCAAVSSATCSLAPPCRATDRPLIRASLSLCTRGAQEVRAGSDTEQYLA